MSHQYIKRFLSAALLLAFVAPSTLANYYDDNYENYYDQPSASSMVLKNNISLTQNNNKVTLSLRDSDVKQVLRMFADKAGLNVVFHNSVSGKVTLDLVDMPINEAFDLVLQVTGLNYYTQNNTLIVISKNSKDNATFSKQEMMTFPVKYVAAEKIAQFLNNNVFGMHMAGMSSVDAATVNAATNEIIVFGMPTDAAIVQKVISQLDREPLSKTFAVNHTTPEEMANMICDMLLPSRGSGTSSSGSSSNDVFMPPMPGVGTTGAAAGIMTGAAASASSGTSELKLGESSIACSISTPSIKATAAPFDVQNLSISFSQQRGTITLIGGSLAQQDMIEKFIRENDVKQAQAYLEVSIVELNEDGSKEYQNTWGFNTKNWAFKFQGGATSIDRDSAPGHAGIVQVDQIAPDGSIVQVPMYKEQFNKNSYLSWHLNYLIENRKARVLANPKLIITSGQESIIDLTQDYVEKVTSEFLSSTTNGPGASGSVQRTYTIGKDKGIKVSLIPFISPDGYVTMNIKPEYSTEAGQVTTPGEVPGTTDLQATLLSRRNLDLKNVRIKDGETLALGGLIQEEDVKTVQKIPVLGDLPLVGPAFRSTKTKKTKTELVFLITPRIINDGEGSVADSL